MELHELEIAHLRAAPVRHREPVSRCDRGVRRLPEHASRASSGQQHGTRPRDARAAVVTHEAYAPALAAGDVEPRRERIVQHANAGAAAGPAPERAGDFAAGDVTG